MQTESKEKPSIEEIALEGKLSELSNSRDNNHHVVPLGILIVLCTIFFTFAGLRINYNYYFKPAVAAFKLSNQNVDSQDQNVHLNADRNNLGIQQLPLCRQIDIFFEKDGKTPKQLKSTKRSEYESTGILVGMGNKLSKNGKRSEGNKKKDNAKKSNTAEPIIYLFALVFIYLLLKAASDINQHYKSQNKGDKRLRRCSLQSYAHKDQRTTHLDRRASKVAPMQRKHIICIEDRSVSLDRNKYTICRQSNINMRKQSLFGDHPRTCQSQHTLTAKLPNEPRKCRRLSVPISINYQTIQVTPIAHPELARRGSVISIGSIADMNIVSPIPMPLTAPSAINTQATDLKRRVRMINRH